MVNRRRLDERPGIVASGDQLVDLDAQPAELVAPRDEGKIGAIGLSNVSLDQLRHALPAGIVCVQNLYNMLDRSAEPLLDACCEHGLAFVPFFPLGGAVSRLAEGDGGGGGDGRGNGTGLHPAQSASPGCSRAIRTSC